MLIPYKIERIIHELNYALYIINIKINALLIKYNNWNKNATWCTAAIEVNPYYNNLLISKNYKQFIFKQYNLIKNNYPEIPLLQPNFKQTFLIFKLIVDKISNRLYTIDYIDYINIIIKSKESKESIIQIV